MKMPAARAARDVAAQAAAPAAAVAAIVTAAGGLTACTVPVRRPAAAIMVAVRCTDRNGGITATQPDGYRSQCPPRVRRLAKYLQLAAEVPPPKAVQREGDQRQHRRADGAARADGHRAPIPHPGICMRDGSHVDHLPGGAGEPVR
jgi:hypothetical protein